jgi:N-acetylglucosamine-6-sulfatase
MRFTTSLWVLLVVGCAGGDTESQRHDADSGSDASVDAATTADLEAVRRPNVVFVLTDDLAWNLIPFMPSVQKLQKMGTTFSHYFVTDSLCCPSRSSIFTGKYPHDTTVFTNTSPGGGYAQFQKAGNAGATFATTLKAAGYQAAMMGKYLNGYDPTMNQADPGWSEWDVAGNGYPEFNYQLNQNGAVVNYGSDPASYLVDVLSGLGDAFVKKAAAGPFLVEIATFAPHAPYTPAPRYLNTRNEMVPRTPAFNMPNTNPPKWLSVHAPLTAQQVSDMDTAFNLRVEAVQAVDDLIDSMLATLQAEGVADNTYVVFSSDNGYHMGDHQMLAGKQTAFDHDINVPLVVVGPGVPAGATVDEFVSNIDLCPTFAELGGATASTNVDGRSLVPFLRGQPPAAWRQALLVEHHGPAKSGTDPTDPDMEGNNGPDPNSYEAVRMANSVFVQYQDGETEYYDLSADPYELNNTVGTLAAATVKKYQKTITAIRNCHSTAECQAAEQL